MTPGHDAQYAVSRGAIALEADPEVSRALRQLIEAPEGGPGPLADIARHLPIAVLRTGPDGRFTVAQGAALDRLGLGHGELVGTSADGWGPDAAAIADRVNGGTAEVFETEGRFGDVVFRFRCLGVPDGSGGSLTVVMDLTTVLEAEQAATASQELISSALDASGAGLVLHGADGGVLTLNQAAGAMLGVGSSGPGDADPLAWLDPVREDGEPFTADELPHRIARRTGVVQRNVRMGLLREDGERAWVTATSHPITLDGRDAVMTSLVADGGAARLATEEVLRDSDERFRLMAERSPIGIFVTGRNRQILYVNPAVEELTGRSASEIRDAGWPELIHADDLRELQPPMGMPLSLDPDPVEYRVVRPDGTIRWVRARAAGVRDEHGDVVAQVGTAADVTDVHEAAARLQESEERTRAILETAAEGIVSFREDGLILEFNAAAERIFGFDSDEVIGQRRLLDLVAPADRDRMAHLLSGYLDGAPPLLVGQGAQELLGVSNDGIVLSLELAVSQLETSEGRLFTGVVRDLTESKAFERELEHLATHDALTGLPNRTFLVAQLEAALNRASRYHSSVGVLMVEIDRVKLVSEALGHRAGDELLTQAASRLRTTAGPAATVARFSNDQFVIVVEDLDDVGDAVELAAAVIDAINDPFMVGADEAFVNATVGIAFAPDGSGVADVHINNADVAMSRAKSSSATRYEVFDTEMRAWVEAQRKTEIALRHGIERAEFELFYQPVVRLDDGEITGVEALVRWNHPQRGRLLPGAFIPIAEDSGLIVPMGEQILREAIAQCAKWRDTEVGPDGGLSVAINLSGRQLAHPELVGVVQSALEEADADPSLVTFEITETVLLDDVDTVVGTLDDLKDLGVRLSLDDFGTGYSSLTYLCRLPIDTVKVDRSFVSQLGTGTRDASVVEMVVAMARTLQLDVVAEGVETDLQAEALQRYECRYAQGFLFSEPQPVSRIELLLSGPRESSLRG